MEKKSKKFIGLCKKYGVDPDKVREITSFEMACNDREVDPKNLPIVSGLPVRHRKRLVADYKLSIIAEALRGGELADYTNISEGKYYPVFKVNATKRKPSGVGLASDDFGRWFSSSDVGVRLVFPNWDTAEFFGKHFLPLHKDHHLI